MLEVAQEYLRKMGLDRHQYIVVRHKDQKHKHLHIVANRVGFHGEVASDKWYKNDDITHLELCVLTAREKGFAPGRHLLFGATGPGGTSGHDRILVVGERASGATYRFLIGTRSWFDLVSQKPLPRPDLGALAARLNALEGTSAAHEIAWRAQPVASPSPELWFGRADHAMFGEHNEALEESRLSPTVVRPAVLDALRAAWTFPESD
jgi:hypothetical protein